MFRMRSAHVITANRWWFLFIWNGHRIACRYIFPLVLAWVDVLTALKIANDPQMRAALPSDWPINLAIVGAVEAFLLGGFWLWSSFAAQQIAKINRGQLPWPWPEA